MPRSEQESPEDIAYRIVHYSSGPGEICSAIAKAIRDEKERCAKLVESHSNEWDNTAKVFAKRIREDRWGNLCSSKQ